MQLDLNHLKRGVKMNISSHGFADIDDYFVRLIDYLNVFLHI
jgi:hypothetical protein